MWEAVNGLVGAGFMPHGQCYLWFPELLWLHVGSDLLITVAYYLISGTLLYFVYRRRNIPFPRLFLMFSAFIFACGTTHLLDIWTVWNPDYWSEGLVKLITGLVSMATAVLLIPLLPKALALRSPTELEAINQALQQENHHRQRAEHALEQARNQLEQRVQERTAELLASYRRLEEQMAARHQAEQALQDSERRFRQLAEHIQEVFWMTSPDDRELFYVSPAYETVWGRPRQHWYQGHWLEDVHPEDRERLAGALEDKHRQGGFEVEYRILRPDASLRWIRDRGFPIRDGAGRLFRCAGIAEDITELKQTQQQMQQHQTQLAQLARTSLAGEMASGLAHELNQPLAAIVAYVRSGQDLLAMEAAAQASLKEVLDKVDDQARRAGRIIRRLRDLAGRGEPRYRLEEVNQLIREVAGLLEAEAGQHEVRLRLELCDQPLPVQGDGLRIQQVILNLARNGMEAMQTADPRRRELCIRSRAQGGQAEVVVADTGTGLSAEIMDRIFMPFFSTKPGGIGLGLSVTQSLVEAHHGKLWAAPEPGPGAALHFTLPLRGETAAGSAPVPASDCGRGAMVVAPHQNGS